MDWTGQPDNFVIPITTPEQREKWKAAWKEALDALVDTASEGERGTVRALLEKEVPHEAPRGWMRDVESVFKRDFSAATPERLEPAAVRFHAAIRVIREQAESDPEFFPSPVGQALHEAFLRAMFHSIDSASLGHSVVPALEAIIVPTLQTALKNPDVLILPAIARQRGTLPFEVWANRFRGVVNDVLEGWYRPLVSAFYRLSRLPLDDEVPAEVAQMGQLFGQAQVYWTASSPLSLLVERRIAIVRNSEAHSHTDLELDSERFTFINRNKAGVETDRWSASSVEFEALAVHFSHLGDVMQTFLLTVPFRSLDPDKLFGLMLHLFSSAGRAQAIGGAQ